MRKKLKSIRYEQGLNVGYIAKALGISQSHYYEIEAGIRNPNLKLAKAIADLLDKTMEDVFF